MVQIEIIKENMPDVFCYGHTVVRLNGNIWIEKNLSLEEIQSIVNRPGQGVIKKKERRWKSIRNVSELGAGLYRYLYFTPDNDKK